MRPPTFDDAWLKDGRKLSSLLGPDPLSIALSGDVTAPAYGTNRSKVYMDGGELPESHVHNQVPDPVRRLAQRAATKHVARHEQEKGSLVGFARERLGTVRQALETYADGLGGTGPAGPYSPRSVMSASSAQASPIASSGHPSPHPDSCACSACSSRSARHGDAVDTLAHYSDFMSMQADRLHRALAEPNALELAHRSGSLQSLYPQYQQQQEHDTQPYMLHQSRSPLSMPAGSKSGWGDEDEGYGEEARRQQGTDGEVEEEEEEQRLPAYVLRRYSEVSGVRDKTLGRVVKALAAQSGVGGAATGTVGRSRVASASQGGMPPTLQSVWSEDPRLAGLVAGAELGPDVAASAKAGRRGTLSDRVIAAVRARVSEAAAQSQWREVDPDDDSTASSDGGVVSRTRKEVDARRVTKMRRHTAALGEVRSASMGGAGVDASRASRVVAQYGRGLGRSVTSALATRMTTGGGVSSASPAVPVPRRVSIAAALRASMGGASTATPSPRSRPTSAAPGRAGSSHSRRRTALVSDDESENEFARRVTDAGGGMAAQRQRITGAMAHTVRSLGGAPAADSAAAVSAGGSTGGRRSSGWYLTDELGSSPAGMQAAEDWEDSDGGSGHEMGPTQRESLSKLWAQRNSQSRGGAPAGPRVMSPTGAAAVARQQQQQQRSVAGRKVSHTVSAAPGNVSQRSSSASSRRRLTFVDEVPARADRRTGATAQSHDDAWLLAAMRATGNDGASREHRYSPAHLAMRATWAPVGSPVSASMGGAGAAMGMLASRISMPEASAEASASAGGQQRAALQTGGGSSKNGGDAEARPAGGKDTWAQRVFERVSQAGARP